MSSEITPAAQQKIEMECTAVHFEALNAALIRTEQEGDGLILNPRVSLKYHSADRLSTRSLKFVWCVSGTRGVRLNGMVPGVTSKEFLTFTIFNPTLAKKLSILVKSLFRLFHYI